VITRFIFFVLFCESPPYQHSVVNAPALAWLVPILVSDEATVVMNIFSSPYLSSSPNMAVALLLVYCIENGSPFYKIYDPSKYVPSAHTARAP